MRKCWDLIEASRDLPLSWYEDAFLSLICPGAPGLMREQVGVRLFIKLCNAGFFLKLTKGKACWTYDLKHILYASTLFKSQQD